MRLVKHLLWIGCTAAALLLVAPTENGRAAGDDYWTNYWHWYDGSYRPYYYQHYYQPYDYGYYETYPRSGYYDKYPNMGPNWGYQYYDNYYYGPRNAVQIGPLRFGWR